MIHSVCTLAVRRSDIDHTKLCFPIFALRLECLKQLKKDLFTMKWPSLIAKNGKITKKKRLVGSTLTSSFFIAPFFCFVFNVFFANDSFPYEAAAGLDVIPRPTTSHQMSGRFQSERWFKPSR